MIRSKIMLEIDSDSKYLYLVVATFNCRKLSNKKEAILKINNVISVNKERLV